MARACNRDHFCDRPDELHEQVFDDLDADSIWSENRQRSRLPTAAIEAIDRFLTALRDVDESEARSVVASPAWASAKDAAQALVVNVG